MLKMPLDDIMSLALKLPLSDALYISKNVYLNVVKTTVKSPILLNLPFPLNFETVRCGAY